jgi:hypothetical protein
MLLLLPFLAMPAAGQTFEQDELRYTQQFVGQMAALAAKASAAHDERLRQLEALRAYWKAWCGERPGCGPLGKTESQ